MTIKELEQRSGLERATIRFYEKEDFIHPTRMENNYRDYSEDDLDLLLRIKLLRSLHVPLGDIKALKDGTSNLNHILSKQMTTLKDESFELERAKTICEMIQKDNVTFSTLQAQKYFDCTIEDVAPSPSVFSFQKHEFQERDDTMYEERHPWKRFLARELDFFFYILISHVVLTNVFHVSNFTSDVFWNAISTILPLVFMLFLEPLFLMLFRTTPGKFLFGIKVVHYDGSRISYTQGFERTKNVLLWGLALRIPILDLFFLYKSYNRCMNNETQPWDIYHVKLTTKEYPLLRYFLVVPYCIGIFVLFVLNTLFTLQPPNRSNLTTEQFVENFYHYTKFFETNFGDYLLNSNGLWKSNTQGESLSRRDSKFPVYNYTIEDGIITGVSFQTLPKEEHETTSIETCIYPDFDHAILIAVSLYASDYKDSLRLHNIISEAISKQYPNDIHLEINGLILDFETEYNDYNYANAGSTHLFMKDDNATDATFQFTFSAQKIHK